MSQSLCQNYLHIIFHISFSDPVKIPNKVKRNLCAYMASICKNNNSTSLIINGTNDHVHILCHLSKDISVAKLVQTLKGNSSRWLKKEFEDLPLLQKFSWQKGYGSFSVSPSALSKVIKYIKKPRRVRFYLQ